MNKNNSDFNFRIGNAIERSSKSHFSAHKAKQRIDLKNKDNIYYLCKGNVSAHSSNSGSLIFNIFAPEVFGLEKLKGGMIIDHIRCVTDAEMHVISSSDAIELFNENDLWPCAFENILMYMKIMLVREKKLNQPTIKDSIIQYLKYIWSLRPEQRAVTSIYTHILLRTHISRSSIHKVLAELESDGLIVVKRGILLEAKFP